MTDNTLKHTHTGRNIMLFAAGMGTRLKPLTDILPKALVPVAGKPLLQHVIERIDAAGNTIVINVHHHADQIVNWVNTTRHHWHSDIRISDETTQLLETGGGIKKAQTLFSDDSPVLIHNCDIISNANLDALLSQAANCDAVLLVSERKTQRYLLFDDDMRLVGWTNIATGEVKGQMGTRRYAFSGIHILSQGLIHRMDTWPARFPIMDFYLNTCAEADIRGVVQTDLRLLDVGKLDTLDQAQQFINSL